MADLGKKGDLWKFGMILVVILVLFGIFAAVLSLAETAEEEKARLEAELSGLESQLQQIDGGRWVNVSDGYCNVQRIFYNNWNCDNNTGYHVVKVLTTGVHNQRFNFSGQIADAHNLASVVGTTSNRSRQFIDDTDTDFNLGNLSNVSVAGTGGAANLTLVNLYIVDSGGTKTTDGSATVRTFTSDGSFNPGSFVTGIAVLVIAGGGGGGGSGGGGGGGGYQYDATHSVATQNYTITVGAGGSGGSSLGSGSNGSDSVFNTIKAVCGGGG